MGCQKSEEISKPEISKPQYLYKTRLTPEIAVSLFIIMDWVYVGQCPTSIILVQRVIRIPSFNFNFYHVVCWKYSLKTMNRLIQTSFNLCSTKAFNMHRSREFYLVNSIFSFSHNVFYPMKVIFHVFSKIKFVDCKFFQIGLI